MDNKRIPPLRARKMNILPDSPVPVNQNRLELLLFFDGVAIVLIVLFHALIGEPGNIFYFLKDYSVYLGLTLFTFSAGYKLILNHAEDIRKKTFLGTYFIRRCIRLYKPYLGYTLLMFFPLLIIDYCAWYILNLHFSGIATFFTAMGSMDLMHFLAFFIGDNPVTGHLWYLLSLIIITATVFTVLYFLDLRWLFYLAIPLFLICIYIVTTAHFFGLEIAVRSFLLLPFFILGAWFAFHQQYRKSPQFASASRYPAIIFPLLMAAGILVQDEELSMVMLFSGCILFPFFLSSVAGLVKRVKPIHAFFQFSGSYSFQIYLFHLPLILLILLRTAGDIFRIHYFFMPFLITLLAIYFSVLAYLTVKKVHLAFLIEG
jgi:peptidoglycan/LPS O-acetylase OafA/YrhL